jgi:hypothetical protein
MNGAVAVALTTVILEVVSVFPTVIEQFVVLRVAVMVTSVTSDCDAVPEQNIRCCVCVTNTAVRASNFGTTSHQFVPSFPTMQSSLLYAVSVIGHDRLKALTVAVGAYLSVTTFVLPIGHEPENVAARTCLGARSSNRLANVSGDAAGGVSSA